ncbi:MAG TPA: GAF domain-containing protein, partial [Gemmatimonadales bacterium]|nr:GAF domain-containing protein [Gemmatimonadales bacterium]
MTTAAAPEEKLAAPEWGESALRLLARAGRLLGTSLEYQSTLTELAGLIVPELADLCIVNLAEPNGMVRPLEVVHRDPSAAELVRQRLGPAALSMEPGASPLAEVMRTGQPRLMPDLTPEQISQLVDGQERLELLRSVGLRSVLVVPMRIRRETVGALALARSNDRVQFDESDQALAQELADRAAVAVDHARLFHSEQAARASAERAAATIGRLGGYATRLNRILEGLVQADTIESVSRFISEEAAA